MEIGREERRKYTFVFRNLPDAADVDVSLNGGLYYQTTGTDGTREILLAGPDATQGPAAAVITGTTALRLRVADGDEILFFDAGTIYVDC